MISTMAEKKRSGVKQASKSKKPAETKPKKLLKGGVDPAVGEKTQFKPGESGNPEGKPKGTIHISTHIKNMLNDEKFMPENVDTRLKGGVPLEAIINTAITKAHAGDNKWAEWLAKYGYGQKLELVGEGGGPLQTTVRIIDERQPARNTDTA